MTELISAMKDKGQNYERQIKDLNDEKSALMDVIENLE